MKNNTKIFAIIALSLMILVFSVFVIAKPNTNKVITTNQKSGNIVSIPAHAVQMADNVFSLGTTTDVDGSIVEGIMFVYRKENAKPDGVGKGKGGKGSSSCFEFISKGAKWKNVEPWILNPANIHGLNSNTSSNTSSVFDSFAADVQKWEDSSSVDIFGPGSTTNSVLVADTVTPDGLNEVYFGEISDSGVIAVTIIWGRFSGSPKNRYLVEWDQVYDEVDFAWSMNGEAGKMDLSNIATHEIGHATGMGHPPSECTEETMYAYASLGETKKRDLNSGDIEGIISLYK